MHAIPSAAQAICFGRDLYYLGDDKGTIHEVEITNHVAQSHFRHSTYPILYLHLIDLSLLSACHQVIKLWGLETYLVSAQENTTNEQPELFRSIKFTKLLAIQSTDQMIAAQTTSRQLQLIDRKTLQVLSSVIDDTETFAFDRVTLYHVPKDKRFQYKEPDAAWMDAHRLDFLLRPIQQLFFSEHFFCSRHATHVQVVSPLRILTHTLHLEANEVILAFRYPTLVVGHTNSCTLKAVDQSSSDVKKTFSQPIRQVIFAQNTWHVLLQGQPSDKDLISSSACSIM